MTGHFCVQAVTDWALEDSVPGSPLSDIASAARLGTAACQMTIAD